MIDMIVVTYIAVDFVALRHFLHGAVPTSKSMPSGEGAELFEQQLSEIMRGPQVLGGHP